MTRVLSLLSIWGWLVLGACTPESELGSAVSASRQTRAADDETTRGAAGEGAEVSAVEEPELETSNGTIYGVHGDPITGKISFAAGTMEAGTIDLYCCRAGAYDVYTYEDASCDDPDSWAVERSARIANVTCSNDIGSAPYVRDPADAATMAFVIYDAAGTALGCGDIELD